MQYIWIDSLCIIQDSLEDWEAQAARMAATYRGSYVNLAASFSPHCQGGMIHDVFIPSRSRHWRFINLSQDGERYADAYTQSQIETQSERINSHVIAPTRTHKYGSTLAIFRFGFAERDYTDFQRENPDWDCRLGIPKSEDPLYSRGWVLQEEVLASRTVHFRRDQFRWGCRRYLQSEDGTFDTPHSTRFDDPDKGTPFAFQRPLESSCIWNAWLTEMLLRKFTYDDDRPAAIAGLVDFYIEKTQYTPLLGAWKETLVSDLTWDAHLQKMAVPPTDRSPFPSWSQLSIPAPTTVIYNPIEAGEADDIRTEVSIMDASVRWDSHPFTSKYSGSRLVVSGRVLPIRETNTPGFDSKLLPEIAFLKNWLSNEIFDYVTQNENAKDALLLHLLQRISSDSIFAKRRSAPVLEDLSLILIPVSLDPLVCYRIGLVNHPYLDFEEIESPSLIPTPHSCGTTRVVELI